MATAAGIKAAMGPREWALLITLSLLWGGSFFFAEVALRALPPFTVVLARVGLGAAALLIVLRLAGLALPRGLGPWRAFFAMGTLNNALPFSLIVWGQTEIASGLAAILNATTPLFTVLLAHLLTRDEKLSGAKLAGVGLGVCGVAVMIGPDVLAGLGAAVLALGSTSVAHEIPMPNPADYEGMKIVEIDVPDSDIVQMLLDEGLRSLSCTPVDGPSPWLLDDEGITLIEGLGLIHRDVVPDLPAFTAQQNQERVAIRQQRGLDFYSDFRTLDEF